MACNGTFLHVDGILSQTMAKQSQMYHKALWQLDNVQGLPSFTVYEGMFLAPKVDGFKCDAPTLSIHGRPYYVLDYVYDPRTRGATVLPQGMYRHDINNFYAEKLAPPIFFFLPPRSLGIPLEKAALKDTDALVGAQSPVSMQNKTTTYLCICWPGHAPYHKQVEIKRSNKEPITLGKLAQRVANFVDAFLIHAMSDPSARSEWPYGVHSQIRRQIVLLGVAHVSQGHWQIMLSIKQPK